MVIRRQHCTHHPDRNAIGVCIITRRPICAECSTRYEGVNYSREGLEILRRRRAAEQRTGGVWTALGYTAAAASPLLLALLLLLCYTGLQALTDLLT